MTVRLLGFTAATHTPFSSDGQLRLEIVEQQAAHLLASGIPRVFIGGTTGESHSLSLEERLQLTSRWMDVTKGTSLEVVVHVGANALVDARKLAAHAQKSQARAIAALAPSYFRPRTISSLVQCMADIASAASETPFYYYDIPVMTGIALPVIDFLAAAKERIPNLAGVKYTNSDLAQLQRCLRVENGNWDILFGCDEFYLSAAVLGVKGGVGSTYNFAAPIYHRMLSAFHAGDVETARLEQHRSVQLVELLARYGFMAAAKTTMKFVGVDVGPARLPHENLTASQEASLRQDLETLGYFQWIS